MKLALKVVFVVFFLSILYATVTASLDRGLFDAGSELMDHLWFRATLVDTYAAFLTIYLWIAYKERTLLKRILWFVLICCLGTFAFSVYIFIQLHRLKPEDSLEKMLVRAS